jgi:predicted nucleic acid-binding protein
MTGRPPLIDTNVLVYLFDGDAPAKREASRRLVEGCFRREAEYSVSVQNLAEFAVVVTEKVEHPLPTDDVRRFVAAVAGFDGWHVVGYGGATVDRALELREQHTVHFWDALLAATMLEYGIDTVYSEDAHLSRVPGITVVDPYRE